MPYIIFKLHCADLTKLDVCEYHISCHIVYTYVRSIIFGITLNCDFYKVDNIPSGIIALLDVYTAIPCAVRTLLYRCNDHAWMISSNSTIVHVAMLYIYLRM